MDSALKALYADYGEALMRDGVASLSDRGLADDLVQETMLKAWWHCATFRGDSELFPWLKTILRRGMIDLLRLRRVEVPLSASGEGVDPEVDEALLAWRGAADATPDALLHSKQAEACFRACAARFAKDHPIAAAVMRWVIEDGLGPAELAPLLDRTPGATREYLSKCRIKARVYFAEWYALTLDRSPGTKA